MSIKDLDGKTFRIPAYQRGYRWTRQQIKDLVFDLREFQKSTTANIYCLQPIVLEEAIDKETGEQYFNVIDGQQRLSSLYLMGAAYRWKKDPDEQWPTYTQYNLQYQEKDSLQKLLKEIGESDADNYQEALKQWKETYTGIDSQNVLNVLEFLLKPNAQKGWRPTDALHYIYECLGGGEKDICVIWHELENTDSCTDQAIETFANINANKIPLTDAELIKAVLMQAYGKQLAEKDENGRPITSSTVPVESTFANQWEMIERGLNNDSFWCFFVKEIGKYRTRIDLLFEIWLAKEGVTLSQEDHALYRAILAQLQEKDAKDLWKDVVSIYETLQDWREDYYIYHIIGACSSLKGKGLPKESNAEFVCKLYKQYETLTKKEFQCLLKTHLREHYDAVMEGPGNIRSLHYENYPNETKAVLLLFNIALLLNTYQICPKSTAEWFPFDYYKSTAIEIEHINPRHPEKKEYHAAWRTDLTPVIEENNKTALVDKREKSTIADLTIWESAAEVHSIGNLTLVDKKLNIGFSNGNFQAKRNHVLSAMYGEVINNEKSYSESVLFPGARWVFMRQWRTDADCGLSPDLMTKNHWSKAERNFYVEKLERSLALLLGDITAPVVKEETK